MTKEKPENGDRDSRQELVNAFLAAAQSQTITVRRLIDLGVSLFDLAQVSCTSSVGSRREEAAYLTHFALGVRDLNFSRLDEPVTMADAERVLDLFERRISERVPAAYLTNEAVFHGYRFYVDERAFVPRSTLSQYLDDIITETSWENERVLDLGTGLGTLGILVALKRPSAVVDLVDISPDAIDVALENIRRFGLGHRVNAIVSDLFSNVSGPYSLIISNPPFVTEEQYELESTQEAHSEPRLAIVGGKEGLDVVLPVIRQASRYLTPNGLLVMEVGPVLEGVLKERYPHMDFRWMGDAGQPWPGVLMLRNGYPPLDREIAEGVVR